LKVFEQRTASQTCAIETVGASLLAMRNLNYIVID